MSNPLHIQVRARNAVVDGFFIAAVFWYAIVWIVRKACIFFGLLLMGFIAWPVACFVRTFAGVPTMPEPAPGTESLSESVLAMHDKARRYARGVNRGG